MVKRNQALSRRAFLARVGRICASVFALGATAACGRDERSSLGDDQRGAGSAGDTPVAENADLSVLAEMIATLFPGPGIEDRHFLNAARQVQSVAAAMGSTALISSGIGELRASGWENLSRAQRTDRLESIEASGFFQFVRFNASAALYGNSEVGLLYGYEGESFSKGGYVNRGVNDLAWLPEPGQVQ